MYLEIEKVNTNSTAMKNVEFKISVGTDTNKSMVISKDGKTIDKITVEKDITFEEGAGSYSKDKVVKATIDGVVLLPSLFGITTGSLPSITATQEFVVPKSIPIIFPILFNIYNVIIFYLLFRSLSLNSFKNIYLLSNGVPVPK